MSIIIAQRAALCVCTDLFCENPHTNARAQSCVRSLCVHMLAVYVCVFCVFPLFRSSFHVLTALSRVGRAPSRRRVYTLTTPVRSAKFAQCKYWLATHAKNARPNRVGIFAVRTCIPVYAGSYTYCDLMFELSSRQHSEADDVILYFRNQTSSTNSTHIRRIATQRKLPTHL